MDCVDWWRMRSAIDWIQFQQIVSKPICNQQNMPIKSRNRISLITGRNRSKTYCLKPYKPGAQSTQWPRKSYNCYESSNSWSNWLSNSGSNRATNIMSRESLRNFLHSIDHNQALRRQVADCLNDEELIEIARRHLFFITKEDLNSDKKNSEIAQWFETSKINHPFRPSDDARP